MTNPRDDGAVGIPACAGMTNPRDDGAVGIPACAGMTNPRDDPAFPMTTKAKQPIYAARSPGSTDSEAAAAPLDSADQSPAAPSGVRAIIVNAAVPAALIITALVIGAVLINSPPHVPKSEPETLSPVVGVAEFVAHDAEVFVDAFGTVVAARELRVMPEVGGRIIELNPRLQPGGLLAAGELLLRIDPADYEIGLAEAEANLAVAEHETERLAARIDSLRSRGQQLDVEIAYLQWHANRFGRLAEEDSAGESEARDATTRLDSQRAARRTLDAEIVEQEKAVESALASVGVARTRLDAPTLALERTEVTVPFDAVVVSESVETGQLIGSQAAVATLVATHEFWAEAAIPVARLRDIRFAIDGGTDPSRVIVSLETGEEAIVREGVALRPLGSLDPLGRMARVLVSIRDPLGLSGDGFDPGRRVLLGSYVRLRIESGTLRDVFSIPRKALRENDRVWVRDADGRLAIRPVNIVWRRQDDVLVRNGFQTGDRLVTTHLASVVPGMALRVREEPPALEPPDDLASPSSGGSADAGGNGGSTGATP